MMNENELRKTLEAGANAHKNGRFAEAEILFRQFLSYVPDEMRVQNYLGRALADQGKIEEAIVVFSKVIEQHPQYPETYNNLGRALTTNGNHTAAKSVFEKAVELDPNNHIYIFNYANSLNNFGEYAKAEQLYRRALSLKSDFTPAYVNLALVVVRDEKFSEAEELCKKAIGIQPGYQFAYETLAKILEYRVRFPAMIEVYEKLLLVNPNHAGAIGHLVMLYQYMCDWEKWEIYKNKADAINKNLFAQRKPACFSPFVSVMSCQNEEENQKVAASHFAPIAAAADKINQKYSFEGRNTPKEKIIIGYISADMREHALGNNIQYLFGEHNKNKFEIHVYATNRDDKSYVRDIIKKGADKFFKCDRMSEPEIANLIYNNKVDILVDLTGYMAGQKLLVSAMRPAPIIVSYLGYLGTLGSKKIDYIIADKILIPEEQQKFYSERCAYIPETIYINHIHEKISEENLTKKDFGLPENAFVFNAHHSNYKIDPVIFSLWMRLLHRVENSVLWLRELSETGKNNLLNFARKSGIPSSRIFFSKKLPRDKYFKRLSVMDLGLDTRLYSGGSTTMDSLWAGLPIISLLGTHCASRMSASIINGVGLYDELVVNTLEEYEERAFELATNPEKLKSIKEKLIANRLSCRLFNTKACAEALEELYEEMWSNYCSGKIMYRPEPNHRKVGLQSLAMVNGLLFQGRLKETRMFSLSLYKKFPEIFEPYAILYDIIYKKQEEYRGAPTLDIKHGQKKKVLLSFTVWGDKYIGLFCDYCIPCLLAPGNLPAVSEKRDILMDIYAHAEDIQKIKSHEAFIKLSEICDINFIEFPKRIITCEGYKINDSIFRYNIYGGFHHLSIERARSIGADVICLGPDNLYSDGSFANYVRFIDEGYSAVLFTCTRAQAEFLVPVLDRMKDPEKKYLSITSDELVEFSAQYIHHSFLHYFVTDSMTPSWRHGFFIPDKHGLYIRSFHFHPVIISAEVIDRSKDIKWAYNTVDFKLITALFPDKKDWQKMKFITDSRDGIMLDIAYGSPGLHHQKRILFTDNFLDGLRKAINENEFWNFQFAVDYKTDKEINSVRGYVYGDDGNLHPVDFPINDTIENIRKRIDDWYINRKSKLSQ